MRILLLPVLLLLNFVSAFSIGQCDDRPFCRDRSFFMTRNTGNAIHYMDVTNYNFYPDLKDGFTFEAKFKLTYSEQIPDKLFIAGVWGPFEDQNDSWVLYINSQREICFEISNPTTNLQDTDNTIVEYPLADTLTNRWYHASCIFDPNNMSISLYLDGDFKASVQNQEYPISSLKRPSNPKYGIQIGSTNALYNDGEDFISFLGEMDEIKIWNRVLSDSEIECSNKENYIGNENGLSVYYRCNSDPNDFEICDATANGRNGEMRSNAQCRNPQNPRWQEPEPFVFIEEPSFTEITLPDGSKALVDTIRCDESKTYRWSFIDTGDCSASSYYSTGAKLINGNWNWNRNQNGLTRTGLTPINNGSIQTAEITVDADFVGTERYRFYVIKELDEKNILNQQGVPNANRYQVCSRNMYVENNIYITRITDMDYSADSLDFGVVKSNCLTEQTKDVSFKIINNTINTGLNQPRTVENITFDLPEFQVISPSLPASIPPGSSIDVVVRFTNPNISGVFDSDIEIFTNDRCEQSRSVPIKCEVREVVTINAGGEEITEIDFGRICVGPLVSTQPFFWENLLDENINIVNISYPQYFEGPTPNNLTLEPETSYRQNYFGFTPQVAGDYLDTVFVDINAEGCIIRRPIIVKATALKPDYSMTPSDTLDFGDVFIGQSSVQTIDIENISITNTNYRNYLFQGDNFRILSNVNNGLNSGQTKQITIEFTPLEQRVYNDAIRVEDVVCFESYRVFIKGNGVIDAFDYSPPELRIDNVTACEDSTESISIINSYTQAINLSNFRLIDPSGRFQVISPSNLIGSTIELQPQDEINIQLEYTPNDLSTDRSDIAYIEYQALNQSWKVKATGTSIVPRLYMTGELNYGSSELTVAKVDTVTVENITGADIAISGFNLKDGIDFRILKPLAPFDTILKPREEMEVVVEFYPTQAGQFIDSLFVLIDEPCTIPLEFAVSTELIGIGEIIPMEINQLELSFGQVSPCDCATKVIPLRNRSRNNSIQIDSVYLTSNDPSSTITNYEYFSWEVGGVTEMPKTVESGYTDSLYLSYCPRAPFIKDSLLHSALINVEASGPGWNIKDEVYITGRQMLLYETLPELNEFPPTRVDTFSVKRTSLTTIPSSTFNEDQSPITVESISFTPDENVFYYSTTFGTDFPMTFNSLDEFWVDIDFKPRAPREYRAKMNINISSPCNLVDSTVEVYGSGFAPAFGLDFEYKDTINREVSSSFSIASCDTIKLPVHTSRNIPGEIVNIEQTLKFDTTKFEFVGIESRYLDTSCLGYLPYYEVTKESNNYIKLRMFNLCGVNLESPIYISKFIPTNGFETGSSTFSVDNISFDTEEVILFDIAATPAKTNAYVLKADFEILNNINFEGVNVLDCKTDSISLQNTGELNILVSSILENLSDVDIIDVVPPYGSVITPGDSTKIIFEYCPMSKNIIDSNVLASVLFPCNLYDSTSIQGLGLTPQYSVSADISTDFIKIDTIGGSLKEILNVPLYFEKNLSVTYSETEYWMTGLDFSVDFEYNPRALKFLNFNSDLNNNINPTNGFINLDFIGIDSLRAGKIGEFEFEVTLSDSLFSEINIDTDNYNSDIMFYELIPNLKKSVVNSVGACNLTYLNFSDNITSLKKASPNPVTNKSIIEFTTLEEAEIEFKIYDLNGLEIKSYFKEGEIYESGKYSVDINAADFTPGVYYYTLRSGNFYKLEKMIIAK